MNRLSVRTPLVILATTCCLAAMFASTALAQATALYRIDWAPTGPEGANFSTMNNWGMVVGRTFPSGVGGAGDGFVYDHPGFIGPPKTWHLLSDLTDPPDEWIDVDPLAWTTSSCVGINDLGQVVGYYDREGDRRGFILQLGNADTPVVACEGLPTPSGSTYVYGSRVNDYGDIFAYFRVEGVSYGYLYNPSVAGVVILEDPATNDWLRLGGNGGWYDLNSWGQVSAALAVGGAARVTLSKNLLELLEMSDPVGISHDGRVAGTARVAVSKNRTDVVACIHTSQLQQVGPVGTRSKSLNNDRDVLGEYSDGSYQGFLSHARADGGYDVLNLNDIVTGSADDLDFWKKAASSNGIRVRRINDRDDTGFGQICGEATVTTAAGKGKNATKTTETRHFILTPFQP